MKGPRAWEKRSEVLVSDHRVLKVRELIVVDPRDGTLHPRVVIDSRDWVQVLAVTPDDEVVLVRQYRFGVGALTLELPGGLVEPGEPPEQTAARELEEETGYVAETLAPLGWFHPNPALQNNRMFCYLARGCERVHAGRPDEGEDLEVELLPRAELGRLARDGTISHGLVIAALFLERLHAEG